jgi:hypothetical protein
MAANMLQFKNGPQAIYDLMGKDAVLFHHAANEDPDSTGTQYLQQARLWFGQHVDQRREFIPHDLLRTRGAPRTNPTRVTRLRRPHLQCRQ